MGNAWRDEFPNVSFFFNFFKRACVRLGCVVPFDQVDIVDKFTKNINKCFCDVFVPSRLVCVDVVVVCWFPSDGETEGAVVDGYRGRCLFVE